MRKFLCLLLCVLSVQLFAYDVVLLSDTHYDARELHPGVKRLEDRVWRNVQTWKKRMPQLLKTYRKLAKKSAFVIHCGDLAHGNFSKTDDALEIQAMTEGINAFTQNVPIPFYCIKGNHETYCVNPAESSDKVIAGHLKKTGVDLTGLNYAVMHEGDLYLFFDSNKPDLDFVRRMLDAHPDARYTIFVTHFPVLPCTGQVDAKWLDFGKDKTQYRKLVSLLASRNAIILCGHIHQTTVVRAEFPEGMLTQVSVYSLAVSDKKELEKHEYPHEEYFTRYLAERSGKEIPAHLEDFLCSHYRSFAWYMPGPGVYRLRVSADQVEIQQFSYDGKRLNKIELVPASPTAGKPTRQR